MPTQKLRFFNACTVLVLGLFPLSASAAEPVEAAINATLDAGHVTGLRDCLAVALEHNKKIEISDLEIKIREGEQKTTRITYLPIIKVDGSVIKYDNAAVLRVDLSFLGTLLGDFKGFLSDDNQEQIAAFQRDTLKIKVKQTRVTEGGMTVYQPVGQLFILHNNEVVSKALVDSARQDGVSVKRKVELGVVKAYIALVAATHMESVIQAGLLTLDELEKRSKGVRHRKRLKRSDAAKIRIARADYLKNQFEVWKAAGLARAELNLLMGRPLDAKLEPDPYGVNLHPEELPAGDSLPEAQDDAVNARPEMISARYENTAAEYGKLVAVGKMMPQVNLVGRYHNTEGTGQMQAESAYFGGLVLSWDVWAWGVDYRKMRTAGVAQDKAEAELDDVEDKVRLEVESAWLELQGAQERVADVLKTFELADKKLAAARIQYGRGKTNVTALLDLQARQIAAANDLIIAKVNVDSAGYSLAVARGVDLLDK
jgi:outer membrane protein TolC